MSTTKALPATNTLPPFTVLSPFAMLPEDQPAGKPPFGQVSDFNQHSDLWPYVIAVSTISLVIMTIALAARLYAKVVRKREKLGWEEYLVIFAVLTIVTWTVLYDVACHFGISKHQWNVRASVIPRLFNYLNVCDILYGPMLGTAKFSLLLQLRRYILSHSASSPSFKLTSYLIFPTGAIIIGYYFSCIFQFAFQCIPRRGLWDPTANATCTSAPWLTFAAGGFGLLTDLLLYVLYIWLVVAAGWSRLGGWWSAVPINVVALFGIVTASATLYYRLPFANPDPTDVDLTYHVAIVGIWAMAEYAAIILVGCIPSFGVWFNKESVPTEKPAESETSSNV